MAAPSKQIHFNLETVEVEAPKEPFVVGLPGGETIAMIEPDELDWQQLLDLDDPVKFLRYAISEEDRAKLAKEKFSGKKFAALIEAYQEHFGLPQRGNGVASRIL